MRRLPPSFSGTSLHTRAVGGLLLEETQHASGLKTRLHEHTVSFFGLICSGAQDVSESGRTLEVLPMTMLVLPAGVEHVNHFRNKDSISLLIEFEPRAGNRFGDLSRIFREPATIRSETTISAGRRLRDEIRRCDIASPLAIEGLVLELVAESLRHSEPKATFDAPNRLDRVREILHHGFSESLSLDDLARTVGLHPAHLAKAFRKTFHTTIGDYVRKLRVESACRALAETAVPLAEIAVTVGFYDQSHFIRTFKRLVGVTPSEYRAVFRQAK